MNANAQAQKSFKTFILTLAVSLILFSSIYYLVSSRDEKVGDSLKENSAIVQEKSSLYNYDNGPEAEEPTKNDSNVNEMSPVVSDYEEPSQDFPSESAFGGLAEQKMFITGQVISSDSKPAEEVSGAKSANTSPVSAVSSETEPSIAMSPVDQTPTQLAQNTGEETVTSTVSEEEQVNVDIDKIAANTNLSQNNKAEQESSFSDNTTVSKPEAETTVAENESPAVAGVSVERNTELENIGGPQDTMLVDNEEQAMPQVLAGTTQTTASPVPDTGILSMTVGLMISFATFVFAMIWIIKGPRKMAIEGFEKDMTRLS